MKLNNQSLQFINLFENITKASVKDCFLNDGKVVFIVNIGEASKSIGSRGKNIKIMERLIKKRVKVAEFNDDPIKFVRNYLFPIKIKNIEMKENTIDITAENMHDKALLIGRDRRNLLNLKMIVNKYFKIDDIKIS